NIKTDEFFKASKIVGGIIESSHGVEAEEIGSVSEIKTTIQIGGNFLLIQQQKAYQEKFSEFQKTLIELKDNIFSIVRYGMDEKGHLTHEELSKFEELKKEIRKIKVQTNILERKLAGIANKINMSPNPLLNANTIYPNTIIRFGLVEKVVKKILQSVCIQSIDNKIIIKKK
ncbi:MAG: FapA family protein, partial [Chitinispirillia bacterium]